MSKEADAVRVWFQLMTLPGSEIHFALRNSFWRNGELVQDGADTVRRGSVNRLLPDGAELEVRGMGKMKLTFKWEEFAFDKLEVLRFSPGGVPQ